jgi:hypothetical protein
MWKERVRRDAQSFRNSWGLWRSGVARCGGDLGSTVWLRKDTAGVVFLLCTGQIIDTKSLGLGEVYLGDSLMHAGKG